MRFVFPLFVASLAAMAGCDQLTATVQGVSVLTQTPDLELADGANDTLLTVLPLDQLGEQQGVAVAAGLAEKESATATVASTPVSGAIVRLEWSNAAIDVCEIDPQDSTGTYGASNIPTEDCGDDTLEYNDGVEYTTTFETGSDLYSITVTAPPEIDSANVAFSPATTTSERFGVAGLQVHGGGALTVDWSADPSANDRHAFVTLFRINFSGTDLTVGTAWTADANNPVYDNVPREPSAIVDLILKQPVTEVTIPADSFSQTGIYLLILTPVELSTNVSSNLALGSGGLAGAGTAWMFWVD